MVKKKNKPNAFFYFMMEWKKNEEKKGHIFPRGLKDIQIDPICNETWKNLSEDEKSYYKIKAKHDKIQLIKGKRTGLGELLTDIETIKLREQEFNDHMVEYISSLINTAKTQNNIQLLKFYVIHVNFFYSRVLDNNEVEYYPAEISIAEFSLQKGILRVYHEIINDKIQLGFSNAAREQSLKCHQIPLNAPFGKSDYKTIFRDICKFLEPGKENGKFPPLYIFYSKEDVYLPAKSVLSKLAIADNKKDNFLLLYSLENLFASIYNAVVEDTAAIKFDSIIATIELKKDPFAYNLGLECEYHGELQVGLLYCSQSIVKRWIFVLYSFCCNPLGISRIPGVHKPHENSESFVDIKLINSTFNSLNLDSSRSSVSSSKEVKSKYKSERSKVDKHSTSKTCRKPIEIIDYSEINKTAKSQLEELMERPLRPPITKSAALLFDTSDLKDIDYNTNLPKIGRGNKNLK